MAVPMNWGRATRQPGVFVVGGPGWDLAWSPEQVHPNVIRWLTLATNYGPSGRFAPPQELWSFTLQTKPWAV